MIASAHISAFDLRALRLLATFNRLIRPGWFGSCLWVETSRPTWAFARPAGKVLNRLKVAGLAEWRSESKKFFGWQITSRGRVFLASKYEDQERDP